MVDDGVLILKYIIQLHLDLLPALLVWLYGIIIPSIGGTDAEYILSCRNYINTIFFNHVTAGEMIAGDSEDISFAWYDLIIFKKWIIIRHIPFTKNNVVKTNSVIFHFPAANLKIVIQKIFFDQSIIFL